MQKLAIYVYFCRYIAEYCMKLSENISLEKWVDGQMLRGRYIFTKANLLSLSTTTNKDSLAVSLSRLITRGVVMSPWKNFYVVIPMEYKLRGIVPPSFYIDKLMNFLGRDYYVSLLSAAELNGASHQKSMVFQVIANGKSIRSGVKNGTRLEFTLRHQLAMKFTKKVKTQMGYMNVSNPELTALDIVNEDHKVGGLSRAAEVLVELCESITWDSSKLPLLDYFSCATIQRLGFLLELIDEQDQAKRLLQLFKQTKRTARRIPLKQSVPFTAEMPYNKHWKIIVNYKIEIDEI